MNNFKDYMKFQFKLLKPVLGGSFFITTLIPFSILIIVILMLEIDNTFSTINILFFIMNTLYLMVIIASTHKEYIKASFFFRITRKKYYASKILFIMLIGTTAALIQIAAFIILNTACGNMKNLTIISILAYFIIYCTAFIAIELIMNFFILLTYKIGVKSFIIMTLINSILWKTGAFNSIMNFLFTHNFCMDILILLIAAGILSYVNWLFIKKLEVTS